MRKLVKARAGYETLEPKHHTSSAASVEKRSALDLGLVGARLAFQCCAAGSQIRRRAVTPRSSPKRAARFQAPPGWRAFLSRSAPLRLWRSLSTMERSLDSVLVLKVVSKDHVTTSGLVPEVIDGKSMKWADMLTMCWAGRVSLAVHPVVPFDHDVVGRRGMAIQSGAQQKNVLIRRVCDVPTSCDLSSRLINPSSWVPKGLLFVLNKPQRSVDPRRLTRLRDLGPGPTKGLEPPPNERGNAS